MRLSHRNSFMTPQTLDAIFPFFVMGYGLLLTVVLNIPPLVKLAERRLTPALQQQMTAHRGLAMVCLLVGGFWSLQNIWVA